MLGEVGYPILCEIAIACRPSSSAWSATWWRGSHLLLRRVAGLVVEPVEFGETIHKGLDRSDDDALGNVLRVACRANSDQLDVKQR